MKKLIVTVEKDIVVQFDETSEDFKEMFDSYKTHFERGATHESLAKNIASLVSRYGVKDFVEGVGFLGLNREKQTILHNGEYKEQPFLVNIEVDTDLNNMVDFDITYIREEDNA